MKEKLNERLLGLDLRPQSSGPSREVQTTFNPFETTAAAFTHFLGKLARRLSGATLYIYKCVKRPVSGFFFFFFSLSLNARTAEDADTAGCRPYADSLFFHPP